MTDLLPDLNDKLVNEIVSELIKVKGDDKRDRFIILWIFGVSPKQAAISAGYAPTYGPKLVQQLKNNPILKEKVEKIFSNFPERARAHARLLSPQIANIDRQVVELYNNTPQLAIEKPAALKQIKQQASILKDEETVKVPMVTIEIRKLIQNNQLTMCQDKIDAIEAQESGNDNE